MRCLVLLLCLAQLWGCQSVPLVEVGTYRQLNCDDPETEQVAGVALKYINAKLLQGYKHILNQIDKVKVWPRGPNGEVFVLEIDTLETTCHALDPTPVENCTVRQVAQHAVEGDCDFHILKQDGQFTVLSAKCDSSPDSAEDVRKVCPECPLLAPRNNTSVVEAVNKALAAFNAQSNGSYYQLVETSRAQIVPVPPYTYVEFVVAATDCVAKEVIDPAMCNLLAEKQYGFCKGSHIQRLGGESVEVACTMFQPQPLPGDPKMGVPTSAADAAAPAPSPANPAPAAMVVGSKVVAAPGALSPSQTHYNLRESFSMESGESFTMMKQHKPAKPGNAAGPLVRPCPGRIRHFKV
ncbi:PREDICTED: alpha-2-HS-glycoprotein [Condylura cristata]|uniref:alpha-2-HS-glycoprotein n=1 Tax=Condylura cristata TaxID=143302 RepID=UPI0003343EAD|nr:PREDICTED: alpha-2-HS-glycoprotein [Condylura cristata]